MSSVVQFTPRSKAEYARRYAEAGFKIIPVWWVRADGHCACGRKACENKGKHPLGSMAIQGVNAASSDREVVRRWWERYPEANIGLAMAANNLVAVDIDPRNGGNITLEFIEAEHGKLSSGLEAETGGGGRHIVYSVPNSISLPGTLGKGIDLKYNGFIVVEPSITRKEYAWIDCDPFSGDVADPLPDWIRGLAHRVPDHSSGGFFRAVDAGVISDLKAALPFVDCDDYHQWVQAGMALSEIAQHGFEMWDTWSQGSKKYDYHHGVQKWGSFKPGTGLHYESVFSWAAAGGWVNAGTPSVQEFMPEDDGPEKDIRPTPPITPRSPSPHQEEITSIPGALGAAVDWINATARKPQPLFAVQSALAYASTIMGRRYTTDQGNWPSLYYLIVGKSGSGKEHAKWAAEELLLASGYGHLIGPSDYSSDSGIFSALMKQPSHIAVIDELGIVLGAAQTEGNYIGRSMRKALMEVSARANGRLLPKGLSELNKRDKSKIDEMTIHNPALTVLAMTTPSTLFASITSALVEDGFLSRFLIVESPIGRQPSRRVNIPEVPDTLIDWAKGLASVEVSEFSDLSRPVANVLPFSPPAYRLIDAFEARCIKMADDLESEGLESVPNRAAEYAMRLALIVSVSCGSATILSEHAEWAIEYVEKHIARTARTFRDNISDSPHQSACQQTLAVIKKHPLGIAIGRLIDNARKLKAMDKKGRDSVLLSLLQAGSIRQDGKRFIATDTTDI